MRTLLKKQRKFVVFNSQISSLKEKSDTKKDVSEIWKENYEISLNMIKNSELLQAKEYLIKNLNLLPETDNPYYHYITLMNLGDLYIRIGDGKSAFKTFYELYQKINNPNFFKIEFTALIGLGMSKKILNELEESEKYFQLALEKAPDNKFKAFALEKYTELEILKNSLFLAKERSRQAITLLVNENDNEELERLLENLGILYFENNHFQEGGEMLALLVEVSEGKKFQPKLIEFLVKYQKIIDVLANEAYEKKDYVNSKRFYLIMSSMDQFDLKSVEYLKILDKIAKSYYETQYYEIAMKYYKKSIDLMKELDIEVENMLTTYIDIAKCNYYLHELDVSKEILNMILTETNMSYHLETIYYYLGLIYYEESNEAEAKVYIEKGLEINKKTGNKVLEKNLLELQRNNEINELSKLSISLYKEEKYKEAKDNFEKAFKLAQDVSAILQYQILFKFSKIMLEINNDNESERYFNRCLDLIESKKLPKEYKIEVYKQLAIIEEKLERYHQELGYYEQIYKFKPFSPNQELLKLAELYFINEYFSKSSEFCEMVLDFEINQEMIKKVKLLLLRIDILNSDYEKAKKYYETIQFNDKFEKDYYLSVIETIKDGTNKKFLEIFHKNEVQKITKHNYLPTDLETLFSLIPEENKHIGSL